MSKRSYFSLSGNRYKIDYDTAARRQLILPSSPGGASLGSGLRQRRSKDALAQLAVVAADFVEVQIVGRPAATTFKVCRREADQNEEVDP